MGVGGNGAWVGWMMAKPKTKKQDDTNGRVKSGYDVHIYTQRVIILSRQACTDSESSIRSQLPNVSPPLAPFHKSLIYMVSKKHSGKVDQLTLASGSIEHT